MHSKVALLCAIIRGENLLGKKSILDLKDHFWDLVHIHSQHPMNSPLVNT